MNLDAARRDKSEESGAPPLPHRDLRDRLRELDDNLCDLVAHLLAHWRLIAGLGAGMLVGAVLFAWSGLYSVAATSGHYPFFRVFLEFALRQSVETHVMGIRAPAGVLDDPAELRRGAGHYQGGCVPCHGAPGEARNPIARRMLPEPPYLPDKVRQWSPEELFWIVKHGIKYAGMPAWVSPGRDDEVWSVVAFLLRLPGMEPGAYRQLAFGETGHSATAGAAEGVPLLLLNGPAGGGVAACGRCHGLDGLGDGTGAFPRLAGQTEAYLRVALENYALGARPSGIMQPVAAELGPEEIAALAAHYAAQPVRAGAARAEPDRTVLALGQRIATEGRPERGVAPCAGCHGGAAMHELIPWLEGQHAGFIASQLELWMRGVRGAETGSSFARMMAYGIGLDPHRSPPATEALWPLSREEIRAVAAWYESRPPASRTAVARP